ncbi:hypothetical protein IAE22_31575, partial [Bacillus sp. S34]|nr:hypothetical protein [Bacillus sp. S34]
MSDTTPTGSSEPTDAERQYTEDLPDGVVGFVGLVAQREPPAAVPEFLDDG